ncbi:MULTISPECIES: nucleotide 5'-monophosphate nucleosidase PpnN [Shewanella]|uniref:Pyrimidine/purine nucleotide 5'-monophosphate nucleosidase n=2 Tax=Shewanella TaxID=22 RepID=A0AAW8NL97_9GAMM|nr:MULTISPECIES: nucleotide 5'-monophosphate nucleosidase PpnN [Shewanella]MDR8522986.1 nucleotide 5'-monophosphate nucleosidase PpnN [Shewanella fidelis]MDW4811688.1 nucleotide 5'-monophosphate nucleosidase PpnN [Shewanella fidelis]MDW4815809.1 nucleotide 5'-monophosphate nucleosidase PpnN [Shewanella fidelis]MDW4819899.1 nucleotide 5'-monophosphate nucleosidase PpnN [Shewanella fidelis]MDW4824127.1 nucleotide 5'-monophosphate nucleosidase PpnN [Shewanella fidelis]
MIVKISPRGSLDQLSQLEVDRLKQNAKSELYQLYRSCSLAVLASGLQSDNAEGLFNQFSDFNINVLRRERGIKIELTNPPQEAFVDGEIIAGIQEHLFSVLRDIVYINDKYDNLKHINLTNANHITNVVFDILRNARSMPLLDPNIVVCWGGHSINTTEYQYTREVGYELGLRKLDICTGCGPGAMEGPMKGAAIGHAKQRINHARYIGLTEPSIIAAEPPNQIVNELVILPDIEKRLEAFVRLGHGIIIFPGGAGTAEELLYLLGILLNKDNQDIPFPLVLTGPKESEDYFLKIDEFIGATLGKEAQSKYQIVIDDPVKVARIQKQAMADIKKFRKENGDSYQYQWSLKIEPEFQLPFEPTHEVMSNLDLHFQANKAELAANLRKAFSGIVAGNVKMDTIKAIEANGPFELKGDPKLMALMDDLLSAFVTQQRMKLPGSAYVPCYKVIK